jgi:two-component system sensor histidine kinase FlrB
MILTNTSNDETMNTSVSNHSHVLKSEKLTDAFQLFNELSKDLSDSYQQLQKQVATLNKELSLARSERLKTLIEKEKLAARLQQILAALPAGVIVLDAENRVLDCNAIAIQYLAEPLIGQNWRQIVKRSLFTAFDNPHERQLSNGTRVSLSTNELGHEMGRIILISDVSEIRSLQDRLNQQKHLSAMGEMVASMAHQVRTPLSTAILYASQMHKTKVSDKSRIKFSRKILERLQYLERQVSDMLIFAKEGHLSMESFSLQSLLDKVNDNMHDEMLNNDLVFQMHNNVQVDLMLGNEDALLGAIMNLLNNAVEALDESGQITLHAKQNNSTSIQLKINDNGLGIDDRMKLRLFEPFYSTKVNGTGLGLAVVDSVIRAHSGSIQCESENGDGTTFTLNLPCVNQYVSETEFQTLETNEQEQYYETV